MSIIRDGFQSADLDVPVVLPTLNLDFANSQSLDERITFTRGSIGTFVNKNGLIETIAANQPRFDYDPITGECKGLLIEESRQNYELNSGDPTQWASNQNMTLTGNSIVLPDGTTSTNVEFRGTDSGANVKLLRPGPSGSAVAIGETWTFSIFLRAGTEQTVHLNFQNNTGGDGVGSGFNLVTGQFTGSITGPNAANGSRGYQYFGNGWYRVWLTNTYQSVSTGQQTFVRLKSNTTQMQMTTSFSAWGAQLEKGAFPTSYIPTSGSTLTRSADNASMTGTNFSSVFGSGTPSELSSFYSGLAPYVSNNSAYYWQLTNTAITERIIFRYAGLPQIIPYVNGLSMGGVFANATQIVNMKSVGLIDNKSFAIRVNDGNPDYQFTNNLKLPRIPTGFQQLNIGSSHNGFNYLNGTIRKLAFYPKRLSSSQAVYLIQ